MTTQQTPENIRETFVHGISGILKIQNINYSYLKKKVVYIPFLVSLLSIFLCSIFKINPLIVVLEVKSIMINFLPGILGFTIAGYSLMVGFIQAGILDKISEPLEDSKFSLYQKMSATFATNILIQIFALIFAYLVHFINYFDTNKSITIEISNSFQYSINYIGLLCIVFWFLISLFMAIQIVLNIFMFSQLHHYFINKFKIEEKLKKSYKLQSKRKTS